MGNSLYVKVSNQQAGTLIYENNEYVFDYTTENKDNFISLKKL